MFVNELVNIFVSQFQVDLQSMIITLIICVAAYTYKISLTYAELLLKLCYMLFIYLAAFTHSSASVVRSMLLVGSFFRCSFTA